MGEINKPYTKKVKKLADEKGYILGADITRDHTVLSYPGLYDEGYRIIMHKGGEDPFEDGKVRPDDPDTHLGAYLASGREAKDAGIKWGMFWYIEGDQGHDVIELVTTMRNAVKIALERDVMDTALVLDFEGIGNEGLSDAQLKKFLRDIATEWVRQGGTIGTAAGQLGGIYASNSWWNSSELERFEWDPELDRTFFRWIAKMADGSPKVPDFWETDELMWAWQPMLYLAYSPNMKSGFGIDLWKPGVGPFATGESPPSRAGSGEGTRGVEGAGGGGAGMIIGAFLVLGLGWLAWKNLKN